MTRITSPVSAGNDGTQDQYNNLRTEAEASSRLQAQAQATPALTLRVSEGSCYINGARIDFAGGNSPSFTAPASNPRIDCLSLNSSGVLVRTAGTENASPTAPALPADSLPICLVYNRVGQSHIDNVSDGTNGYIQVDTRNFLLIPQSPPTTDVQTFLSNGTWTKPTSGTPKMVLIEVWGGGGSGGRSNSGSGGGGGGAYSQRWILPSLLGATETVTIGDGGAGRTSDANGASGGNTTFGSWLTGYGGEGGGTGSNYGGGGGGKQGAGGGLGVGFGGLPAINAVGGIGYFASGANGMLNTEGGGACGGGGAPRLGGSSVYGGGGGGGASGNSSHGGASFYGGGGGGGGYTTGGNGGASVCGGAGGAGGSGSNSGTAGAVPSGGGGGTLNGTTSGAGGKGKCQITTYF